MRTTIDGAGRLVVPKPLRDAMGLEPGMRVDMVFVNGHIEIDVAPIAAHVERRGTIGVIVPDEPVPPMSAEVVRETLEATRR